MGLVRANLKNAFALLVLSPAIVAASSLPQEQALFLAGLRIPGGGPLAELQNSPAYENHREQLGEKWDYCRKARWDAMQSWARKNLPRSSSRGVVRYLFGGPDFLGVHAFFPDARTIVLGGLEPVGAVTSPEELSPASLEASLGATRTAIGTALFAGYFVTREMNAQLRQGNFWGVLPLLYAQLALTGNKILSVDMVRPFGSPGVKIDYRRGWRGPQTLYYFQANVANGADCGRFLSWLDSLGEGASYLKAASYLMHGNGFSQVRSFLIDTSSLVVEDDSGIPFRHFDPEQWKIKVFGEYAQPIFSGYYQNDFRDAYATRANAGPLPFGAGYQVFSDKANILVAARAAARVARATAKPEKTRAPELHAADTVAAVAKAAASPDRSASGVAREPELARTTVYLHDAASKSAPATESTTASRPGKSLVALEAEELRIRQNPALSQEERMRQLRDIWQKQLAVMGKTPA